jgi:uncharacterized protein involved in outer membrane biogenesis
MNGRRIAIVVGIIVLVPLLLLGAMLLVVQSAWAERWVEGRASAALHREVRVDTIRVHLGWPPTVAFARLRIANPPWAATRALVDANGLAARVAVPPLFAGKVAIPYLEARSAVAGLEMQGDRATWRFGPASDKPSPFVLGTVKLGDGKIRFIDAGEKTDVAVEMKGSLGEGGELVATGTGTFRAEPMRASVRIPHLDPQHQGPIDFSGEASFGKTHAKAEGMFRPDGDEMDFRLRLAGDTAKHLSRVTRILLPDTPPYDVAGHLIHTGADWTFDGFQGKVGDSDLRGSLTYHAAGKRPFLRGDLHSALLDLADLGPVIGAAPGTRPGKIANAEQRAKSAEREAKEELLPHTKFSVERWDDMDADVRLESKRIQRPSGVPIESFATRLVLKDSVLRLSPLTFGMAGGRFVSDVTLDARTQPVKGHVTSDIQGLKLNRLFPASETMKEALGTLYGRAKLDGTGQSVAQLLGTSNGRITLAVDGGRVSDLLVNLLELDVADVMRLLGVRRNQQVDLRCAVGGFDVRQGVVKPEAFVVDTEDSQVNVSGSVSLADETMDLTTHPLPKDPSFFSLRTPIDLKGPLRHPKVHVHAGPIAARVAGAVALAAVNPALALLPFVDNGPGKDTDCGKLLAEAKAEGARKEQP